MTNNAPLLPRDRDIELATLGALLLAESKERVLEVRSMLPPDCFMWQAREMYEAMCDLAERGEAVNHVMLQNRLRERGSKVSPVDIAELTNNLSFRSDLSSEIAKLREFATRRAILRHAEHWFTEAQAQDADVAALVERIKTRAGEFDAGPEAKARPVSLSWADLCEMKFPPRETLLHETERGEVVMCAAITNRGKTTLWRNAALSLATGRPFEPLVKQGPPRVVYYLDFETRLPRVRADITNMLGSLEVHERALVAQNFHLVADCRIDGLPLTLSNPKHLAIIEADARRVGADVLVVDTITAAFDMENENDNAQGTRIMKQLLNLAQRLNAVVIFLHHIGKAKQEEGQTATNVHRARGGSALSGNATAIFNILPDPQCREIITLECAKVKGEFFPDTVMRLNQEMRWFGFAGAQVKPETPYEQIIGAFNGVPLKRADVMKLFPGFPESSVDRHLKEAVKKGDLLEIKRAVYQKPEPENKSPQSPHAYRDEDFEDFPQNIESAEDSGNLDEEAKNAVRTFFVNKLTFDDEEKLNEERYLDAIDD